MAQRYLVVSDLHLSDIEDNDDGWRYYKHSRFRYDKELSELLASFEADGAADDRRFLVLNGDIIDFDLVCAVPDDPPWHLTRRERKAGLRGTEAKSVWKLELVLQQHPELVDAFARFVACGHTLVYVFGNHDPEMNFDAVRDAFERALRDSARRQSVDFDAGHLQFESWFFYVPGQIYAEHGSQYDYYSSFRYVMHPFIDTENPRRIALPMGNLSNRRLMSQMGFFNPHATDYILNVFRYVHHWLKHYAFTRRGLVWAWAWGSIVVLARLLWTRREITLHPPDLTEKRAALSARTKIPVDTLVALDNLKRMPITNRLYRMVREFWIDRAILAGILTAGTITLALLPIPLWIKLMVPLSCFPLLYLIYEWFAHGETVFSAERQAADNARRIGRLLPVPVITFGHSHHPECIPLVPGVQYINTGTWAPVTAKGSQTRLVVGLRNALFAVFEEGRVPTVRLETFVPDERSSAVKVDDGNPSPPVTSLPGPEDVGDNGDNG